MVNWVLVCQERTFNHLTLIQIDFLKFSSFFYSLCDLKKKLFSNILWWKTSGNFRYSGGLPPLPASWEHFVFIMKNGHHYVTHLNHHREQISEIWISVHLDVHVPTCRSTIDVFLRIIDFFFFFFALYRGMICINLYYPLKIHGGWRMAVYRGN